jgi:anti-sigma factor RsiW
VEVKHPVEVGADNEAHLDSWLSNRLGRQIKAPHLDDLGFVLVGGRLLPFGGKTAAQFMYQDKSGRRITLFVTPSNQLMKESDMKLTENNGNHSYYWVDDELACALTGTMVHTELRQLADLAYKRLESAV